jgi:hypothetical protein
MNKPNVDDSEKITQSEYAKQLFITWKDAMADAGIDRFLAKNRDDLIAQLVDVFIDSGVNYNTAITFAKELQTVLVTKEGKKDTGKYKGWKNTVEEEFRSLLLTTYMAKKLPINVEDADNAGLAVVGPREIITETVIIEPTYGDNQHLKQRTIITAWAKHRFDYFYNSQLDLLAHRIGHELNVMFQKEVLKSEWLVTRKDVPEWAVAILSD